MYPLRYASSTPFCTRLIQIIIKTIFWPTSAFLSPLLDICPFFIFFLSHLLSFRFSLHFRASSPLFPSLPHLFLF